MAWIAVIFRWCRISTSNLESWSRFASTPQGTLNWSSGPRKIARDCLKRRSSARYNSKSYGQEQNLYDTSGAHVCAAAFFSRQADYRGRDRWLRQKHATAVASEMAGVEGIQCLPYRMEFIRVGPRDD